MAKKTFIQEFAEKHFTGSYAKQLRAVKTGEFLFKFFNPGSPVPTDPAELSTLTCAAMVKNEQLLPDDVFVRILLLHSRDKDGSSLLTFDMVADLLESDVYKKFGTKAGSNDANLKKDFEHWLISKSTMARVYGDDSSIQNVDVVLNQDGIHRILNALEVSGYKDDLGCTPDYDGYRYKINQRVDNFNSVFVNGVGVDELDKLVANNQNDNQKYADKLKNVYRILGGQQHGAALSTYIDATTAGQDTKTRNAFFEGQTLAVNKILLGVAQQKSWNDDQLKKIIVKTPAEKNAAKFAPQPTINAPLDCLKTFGLTLGGATAISTVTSIPEVGKVVGSVLGIGAVVGAGVHTLVKTVSEINARAAARGEKVSKGEIAKIALKTGVATVEKAAPYALAMVLGPVKYRAIGAGIMFAKTMLHDLDRRANERLADVEQYEAQFTKPRNMLDCIKNVLHVAFKEKKGKKRLNLKDVGAAALYGAGKAAAVLAAGSLGQWAGHALGSSVDTAKLMDNLHLSDTKLGKMVGSFDHGHVTEKVQTQSTDELTNHGNDISGKLPPLPERNNLAGKSSTEMSYSDKYIAEHPNAFYDSNGWVAEKIIGPDGKEVTIYPVNENKDMFGLVGRKFRNLTENEMLSRGDHGNIINKPISHNNAGNSESIGNTGDKISSSIGFPQKTAGTNIMSNIEIPQLSKKTNIFSSIKIPNFFKPNSPVDIDNGIDSQPETWGKGRNK